MQPNIFQSVAAIHVRPECPFLMAYHVQRYFLQPKTHPIWIRQEYQPEGPLYTPLNKFSLGQWCWGLSGRGASTAERPPPLFHFLSVLLIYRTPPRTWLKMVDTAMHRLPFSTFKFKAL